MGNSLFGDLRGGVVDGLLDRFGDTGGLGDEGLDLVKPALGLVHERELRRCSGLTLTEVRAECSMRLAGRKYDTRAELAKRGGTD